ncbi:pimeloyl-ACP methyl ester esterase BioH [Thiospirillum jenense]|uniref:Pimeloyl-ACP methyl ester esterase BioH n=2 Tax=Thiospirillum jenense TaxID=1653858 RepID=A0A839H964_9GAMM|nr:pimeloyl-ACP methyl ester esterase BioH [Thiospirillum jenense]
MSAAVWRTLPPTIAAHHPRHPLDLPGHGHAAAQPVPATLADWAIDCLSRAPERAIWLGWSLGGLVAQQAAVQAPERVAALILVTSSACFVQQPDWPAAIPVHILERFHAALVADPAVTLDQFLALQVLNSNAARDTLRHLRSALADSPAPAAAALATGLNLLRNSDLRPHLRQLRQPTLWLLGERDTLVPARVAADLAHWMPASHQRVIAGSGHAPWLSHPDETAAVTNDFLQAMTES